MLSGNEIQKLRKCRKISEWDRIEKETVFGLLRQYFAIFVAALNKMIVCQRLQLMNWVRLELQISLVTF
jgi:hypothetical protein